MTSGACVEKGFFTIRGCHTDNTYRLNNAARQSSDNIRTRKKLLRAKRKSKGNKNLEIKGLL